ncbi:hypothetical protein CEXT_789681 [Caerostris extrusa]|uniref:Uncharacterized protein n=1 Tax=Caerostris extrusa TaxID=172846 RepID=A0AAV4SX04_CAEEX|nr:hypothetical protein CEXT_789681 [Caerostris extrusa]
MQCKHKPTGKESLNKKDLVKKSIFKFRTGEIMPTQMKSKLVRKPPVLHCQPFQNRTVNTRQLSFYHELQLKLHSGN